MNITSKNRLRKVQRGATRTKTITRGNDTEETTRKKKHKTHTQLVDFQKKEKKTIVSRIVFPARKILPGVKGAVRLGRAKKEEKLDNFLF